MLVCRGRWFYITAGHILSDIHEGINNGGLCVDRASFVDCFGPEAKDPHPIPFDFAALPRHHPDEAAVGLDLGFIELPSLYHSLFAKNGIIPVEEKDWVDQDLSEYQGFFVIGFPENLHDEAFAKGKNVMLEPTMIPLMRIPNPQGEIIGERTAVFCAQFPEKMKVNIAGCSGGPIFGAKFNPEMDYRLEYQIVAMQFAEWKQKRIAVGCLLPALGDFLTKWIEKKS